MEDIDQEFDFTTGNGGPKGNPGGRPTKEFLEQKKALESLEALERIAPGITAEFLGKFNNGRKSGTKKDLRGNLEGIAESPITSSFYESLTGSFGATLGKPAAVVSLIFALWKAEEKLEGFPPLLHLGVRALDTLGSLFDTLIEFFEGTVKTIQDTAEVVEETTETVTDTAKKTPMGREIRRIRKLFGG